MRLRMSIRICTYAYTSVHIYIYIYIYMRTLYIYTNVIYIYIYIYSHTHIVYVCVYIDIYIYVAKQREDSWFIQWKSIFFLLLSCSSSNLLDRNDETNHQKYKTALFCYSQFFRIKIGSWLILKKKVKKENNFNWNEPTVNADFLFKLK